ncbi:MAG TPA: hypothetical protein VJA26_05430 [Gammaproteobacteria bacterium]|nr:hypothetical protein [Gammaproteobacteria bacterium]
MAERPIIFSGDMVKAILADQKSQTRRVVKPQPKGDVEPCNLPTGFWAIGDNDYAERCPYGVPGDTLWVREAWADAGDGKWPEMFEGHLWPKYRATEPDAPVKRWRPSIHMPRWASRISLRVTGVRVERLNEISPADCIAEGITQPRYGDGRYCSWVDPYRDLWDSLNGKRAPWSSNPLVWCIAFERIGAQ